MVRIVLRRITQERSRSGQVRKTTEDHQRAPEDHQRPSLHLREETFIYANDLSES